MAKFILKRIAMAVVTLFIIATLTFFIMHLIPGGPFLNEKLSDKAMDIINEKYGLNDPIYVQYGRYMRDLLHGDLGMSYKRLGFSVNQIIAEKFPVSAKLGLISIVLILLVGIPGGAVAALKRNSIWDRIIMFISTIGAAVPPFVLGTVALYILGITFKILPTMGLSTPLHFVLPAFSLSFYYMSYVSRLMRSSMLDVIDQDYIKTARAKGLGETAIVVKHALRNAVLPVLTYLGQMSAGILSGTFVVEKIFTIPGLGKYFIDSIMSRDYSVIMGTTIFYAALLITMNLIVDILYVVIDPRIKLES